MTTPETPASVIDVEALIRECVPGGDICDPQQVADAIRSYAARMQAPEGWKLVPVEPTPGMLEAADAAAELFMVEHIASYRAMLSAAPAHPTPEAVQPTQGEAAQTTQGTVSSVQKVAVDIARWFIDGDRPDEWKLKEWAERLDRDAVAKAYDERAKSTNPPTQGEAQ